jgi:hypothetical protein
LSQNGLRGCSGGRKRGPDVLRPGSPSLQRACGLRARALSSDAFAAGAGVNSWIGADTANGRLSQTLRASRLTVLRGLFAHRRVAPQHPVRQPIRQPRIEGNVRCRLLSCRSRPCAGWQVLGRLLPLALLPARGTAERAQPARSGHSATNKKPRRSGVRGSLVPTPMLIVVCAVSL